MSQGTSFEDVVNKTDDPVVANERRLAFAKLRAPFDDRAVGKLPRVTCGQCREVIKSRRGKACERHGSQECKVCGQYMTAAHMHLDYVGHAEVTDRLLSVDPEWDWQPVAREEDGTPRFVRAGAGNPLGLWIRLTVLGVTRLGYGSVEPNAFDPEKQLIGDALRNAAMRFGVALDLWSKAELESTLEASEVVDKSTGEIKTPAAQVQAPGSVTPTERAEIDAFATGDPPAKPRVIQGIPIVTPKTWEQVKTLPLGGKNPFAAMTLGAIVDQDFGDEHEALEYFEGTVLKGIMDKWNRTTPAKKSEGVGLVSECALIAWNELQNRRSAPPTFATEERESS